MRDLKAELEREDGTFPPAWRPQEGEILVGSVVRYGEGPSTYGPVRTVTIEREDGRGRVSVWLSSTVLLALFEREKPRVGERIGLRYLGKHETKGYKKYALIVDRNDQDSEPSFAPLGGERGEPDGEDPFQDVGGPYAASVMPPRRQP